MDVGSVDSYRGIPRVNAAEADVTAQYGANATPGAPEDGLEMTPPAREPDNTVVAADLAPIADDSLVAADLAPKAEDSLDEVDLELEHGEIEAIENDDHETPAASTRRGLAAGSGPKRFMTRRATLKWMDKDYQNNITAEVMCKAVTQYHPRMQTGHGLDSIPLGESTGIFSPRAGEPNANLASLGRAVAMYFKFLKSLVVLMLFFVLLCVPLYVLYGAGEVQTEMTSYLTTLTLGNLGDTSFLCAQQDLRAQQTMALECPEGALLYHLEEFGIQNQNETLNENVTCPLVSYGDSDIELGDLDCKLSGFDEQTRDNFVREFNVNCLGNAACDLPIDLAVIPRACRAKVGSAPQIESLAQAQAYAQSLSTDQARVFMGYAKAECRGAVVQISEGNTIAREKVGEYIVCFDLLIMFVFMLAIWLMEYFIRLDVESFRNKHLETNEFSVKFSNLPSLTESYTAEVLKAELHKVITDTITESDQVIERLSATSNQQNCEIVDINIGFSSYTTLANVVEI